MVRQQEASQDVELESLPPMQQQQRQEPAHQPAPQVHQMFGSPGVFRLHPQRVSAGESTTEGRDTPAASMDGAGFDQNTPAFRSEAETDGAHGSYSIRQARHATQIVRCIVVAHATQLLTPCPLSAAFYIESNRTDMDIEGVEAC